MANRESWLDAAVDWFRPSFLEAGCALPVDILVSMGFPPHPVMPYVGYAYDKSDSADGETYQILISPSLSDENIILGVLLHELIHIAVGVSESHSENFKIMANAWGFNGDIRRVTTENMSDDLMNYFGVMRNKLGEFPHVALFPKRLFKKELKNV